MQTTQQQEERRQLIDRVLGLDAATYIFKGVGANVGLIENEIERQVREGRVDWMAYDVQNLHNVAVNKARSGALCANPRSVQAFQTVFADPQFIRKSGVEANESMILNELVSRGPLDCTPENISQVILDLWNQLVDNRDFQENKADTDRRIAQISAMTDGGQHGFSIQRGPRKTAYDKTGRVHDPLEGQAQGFSRGISGPWSRGAGSKSFDEMTNEEVDALYQEWKTTSDFRNMDRDQLREYVRKAGPTDAFGKNVRVPSVVAPDGGQQLINEATGKEFTQRELIRFLNQAPPNGRNLLVNPNTGRMVPWKKERFEKIIRGELG